MLAVDIKQVVTSGCVYGYDCARRGHKLQAGLAGIGEAFTVLEIFSASSLMGCQR